MGSADPLLEGLLDHRPDPATITADVLAGLSARPRALPSKYFHDARGSALFECITRQPEYYLTRAELDLLPRVLPQIAAHAGPRVRVVEYGSGSGRKTRLLLQALEDVVAYTPVEISRTALLDSVRALAVDFPAIEMLPVCADFTALPALPPPRRAARRTLLFFPGSTLGNFTEAVAVSILHGMRQAMGPDGLALIGIDLDKDPALIEAAYNDAAGVTADFTLNLLVRLNREIGSDFDLAGFAHRARYVVPLRRIETSLVSRRAQVVHVAGQAFAFARDEAMHVEYSHKYDDAQFAAMAAAAGLRVAAAWDAPARMFGLRLLRPA
ncbi:L-histidine N(alpha)-methyltransferase [Stenotrophomonas acidaminiphila]|uniref:L-histidine N(alpha)-methyltransferase n=1 Tax=Stenotrophomonas acidaminiphila TaxID=128780 RepID=UPI002ABDF99F|nr:L-histidine N(alpha)-methyltransferase [Stenotrophomonas acidaminiphila]WPU56086.1 L-histidine N(alpha)-methyltransferase [Stenotrophomonas acidaminiphila]